MEGWYHTIWLQAHSLRPPGIEPGTSADIGVHTPPPSCPPAPKQHNLIRPLYPVPTRINTTHPSCLLHHSECIHTQLALPRVSWIANFFTTTCTTASPPLCRCHTTQQILILTIFFYSISRVTQSTVECPRNSLVSYFVFTCRVTWQHDAALTMKSSAAIRAINGIDLWVS